MENENNKNNKVEIDLETWTKLVSEHATYKKELELHVNSTKEEVTIESNSHSPKEPEKVETTKKGIF